MKKVDMFVLRCLVICIIIFFIGIVWKSLSTNESNHASNYSNRSRDNGLINNTKD